MTIKDTLAIAGTFFIFYSIVKVSFAKAISRRYLVDENAGFLTIYSFNSAFKCVAWLHFLLTPLLLLLDRRHLRMILLVKGTVSPSIVEYV